jgi:NAD(P)-dependent dehydrogenase (short-subunit alcohol dehydrogenase family)
MTNRIKSAFGWGSTAAEVAEGHDLTGKRAIITGGTSGLGLETARVLASRGAEVILTGRDLATATPLIEAITAAGGKAAAVYMDLADLRSVEAFAAAHGSAPLHFLINNAGVMACPLWRTAQGFEMQIGVNHIAHFHLTNLLLPALGAAAREAGRARVVALSSSGHHWGQVNFADPNFEKTAYDPLVAYGQSKSANALFAVELDRRHQADGIRAFSVMPGGIQTNLGRDIAEDVLARLGLGGEQANNYRWKTVEQGSATTVWAALGRELDGVGGLYLEDVAEAVKSAEGQMNGVKPWAIDPEIARQLWLWSEDAIARCG